MKAPDLWGVINLTGDSFYAGSRALGKAAITKAEQMLRDGATVIDVGAESTRPGATEVSAEVQLSVIQPFLADFKSTFGIGALKQISVDTRDIRVMEQVAPLGVGYINDVSGGSE